MYKSRFLGLIVLMLVSCNKTSGSNGPVVPPPPPPPPVVKTLHQGNWDWLIVNVNNSNDVVSGLASFSVEFNNPATSSSQYGKKVAGGLFDLDMEGIEKKPIGYVDMGPIETPLDVVFLSENKELMIIGIDSDGAISVEKGQNAFMGVGRVYFPSQGQQIDVLVGLFQTSTVPTYKAQAATVLDRLVLNRAKSLKVLPASADTDLKTLRGFRMSSQGLTQGPLQQGFAQLF